MNLQSGAQADRRRDCSAALLMALLLVFVASFAHAQGAMLGLKAFTGGGAAKVVGRETVQYLGKIYENHIAYSMFTEQLRERHGAAASVGGTPAEAEE